MGHVHRCRRHRAELLSVVLCALSLFQVGCQNGPPVSTAKLQRHQAMIDLDELKAVESVAGVKVTAAAPDRWIKLPLHRTALFTHQQWRSPTRSTGMGVAYVRMPLPLSAEALVYFAKMEYTKQSKGGRLINQWVDSLGRTWFEAENDRYYVRGYIVTRGLEAWFVYSGHKTRWPAVDREQAVAARSVETIIPQTPGRRPLPSSITAAQ